MKFGQRAYQYYKDLPNWAKGVVLIGGGLISWFGIIKPTVRLVNNVIDKGKSNKVVKDIKDEIKKLETSGTKQSYSDSQYRAWADAIESQFTGCDFSTVVPFFPGLNLTYSGRRIYDIIGNLKNDTDFAKLVQTFGVRTYDDCGPRFLGITGDVSNVSLYGAVTDELTRNEIKILNDKLAAQKISYRF